MEIEEFLKQPHIQDLLAAEDLDAVYDEACDVDMYFQVKLTNFLAKEVGLDPLLYMTKVYSCMFAGLDIKKIIIPDNIIEIGSDAFESCYDLEEVIIGDNVKIIKDCAFIDCENLHSITLPKDIIIGSSAFSGCKNLENSNGTVTYHGPESDFTKLQIGRNNICLKTAYWEFKE